MTLRRAYWVFFHQKQVPDPWERIDANLTISIANVWIAVVVTILGLAFKIWWLW